MIIDDVKKLAITLRRKGNSYSYISKKTGIARSTLSDWLKDIEVVHNDLTKNRIEAARRVARVAKIQTRKSSYERAHLEALGMIGQLTQKEKMVFALGTIFAIGNKSVDSVRFASSRVEVVLVMMALLRALGISVERLSTRVHLSANGDEHAAVAYWSRVAGIPRKQFRASYKVKSKEGGRTSKYGTLHIVVLSGGKREPGVFLFRKVEAALAEAVRQVNRGHGLPV